MSEQRRPHWSDDLLASVMTHCNDIEQCHAVIAAVEDWIDARGSAIDGREVVAAIAAIARVRERAGGPTPAVHGDWMAGYAAAMRDILRALEGDKR